MSLLGSLGSVAANNHIVEVRLPTNMPPVRAGDLLQLTTDGYRHVDNPRQAHVIVMAGPDDAGNIQVMVPTREQVERAVQGRPTMTPREQALAGIRPLLRLPEPEVVNMSHRERDEIDENIQQALTRSREREMATVRGNNFMRLPTPNKAAFSIAELLVQQRNMATHDHGLQTLLEALLVAVQGVMRTRGMQYQAVELPVLDGIVNFAALVHAEDSVKHYSVRMRHPIQEAIQIVQDIDPATARVRWQYVVGGAALPLPANPLPAAVSAELIPTRAERPRRELILEDEPSEQ